MDTSITFSKDITKEEALTILHAEIEQVKQAMDHFHTAPQIQTSTPIDIMKTVAELREFRNRIHKAFFVGPEV